MTFSGGRNGWTAPAYPARVNRELAETTDDGG